MKLTSRERIMRIFANKEIDRPALKLWGAKLYGSEPSLHPMYDPVTKRAEAVSDLFMTSSFAFNIYAGMYAKEYYEVKREDTADPTWKNEHRYYHTPKGDLHAIERISTVGEPSYTLEHFIKEPEDIEKLLSMKYAPMPVDMTAHEDRIAKTGDKGIVMINLDHTGFAMQRIMGSETLAYFSVDYREELTAMADVFSARLKEQVANLMDAGCNGVFGWVGPEVFVPPLLGPNEFEDFVFKYDKPLCDMIHERGNYVWMHCHGRVRNFIDRFIDMGIDVLNPLEPPKNGDVSMKEVVKTFGNQIGLEGNIEIQEFLQGTPDRLRMLIDECVDAGKDSGRFLLCPSAGYMEYPFPTQEYIDNLMLYLDYGLDAVERCRM